MNISIIGRNLEDVSGMSRHVSSLASTFLVLGHCVHAVNFDKHGIAIQFEGYDMGTPAFPYDATIVNDSDSFEAIYGIVKNRIIRTVHGITQVELDSIENHPLHELIAVSANIRDALAMRGLKSNFIRNAITMPVNYVKPAEIKKAVSMARNDRLNFLIKKCTQKLGIALDICVDNPNIDRIIDGCDLVFGIGRSLLDGMSMGKSAISIDKRFYNEQNYEGYGYITKDNIEHAEICNFTGFNNKRLFTEESLMEEIKKAKPEDGLFNRQYVENHYDSIKIAKEYIRMIEAMK